jgi:hypothetical protein
MCEAHGVLMPYVVGTVLSIGVAVLARSVGFDRDRAFYPTVMIVIASLAWLIKRERTTSVQSVIASDVDARGG